MYNNCECRKTNFYFVTSFDFDEEQVILGTNQPINASDLPYCFTFRMSKCISEIAGVENYDLGIYVNGSIVPVLNKYGTPMKYGELILNYSGCLDKRFTYTAYVSTSISKRGLQVLVKNAPKYIAS